MDPNPWSTYNQHYSRLGSASGNPQTPPANLNDLSLPSALARQQESPGSYGGGGGNGGNGGANNSGGTGSSASATHQHPLFLSTHHGLSASQNATHPDASFNTMNLLSPNFDSPLLSSSFQHSAKSHFTGLPSSSHSPFFKSVNKDELADLRGGFAHHGNVSGNSGEGSPIGVAGGSSSLFETAHSSGNSWRAPPMPPTSCGPFGILPHQAVMQNGEKQQQQRSGRVFSENDMSRNYSSILPSPSRPPSSFLDHNSVPHTAALGSQGESQYFNTIGENYYPCTKTGNTSFTPFNSSLSPSISSPSSVSQQNFPHSNYPADKDKTGSASMEPFSPNPGVIVNQLQGPNGQSSSSTSSVSSRPGVISTPGSTVCQNSPNPAQHQASPHMPGFNQIQNYPYPSPSSQHSMSPSVAQSPQHQTPDSRGLSHGQSFMSSNQPSPSVHHSPYPSMNTPAPASTPAHVTPPSSIGQAYCPMMTENSPRGIGCTTVITTVPSCSSANYSSAQIHSPQDPSQHHLPLTSHPTDPLQLNNSHYMSPVGMQVHNDLHHKDMMNLVGNPISSHGRSNSGKHLLESELSAIDAMVEKHGSSSHPGMGMLPLPSGGKPSMESMENMYSNQGMGMLPDYDSIGMSHGGKSAMMEHQSPSDTGLHPAIADFQTIPTTRKRGRGRPRGSVNKRGRRPRRSRRGAQFNCESDRYIPEDPMSRSNSMSGLPGMGINEADVGSMRNTYSSRLHNSRAPHNRVYASRKDNCDSMGYGMLEPKLTPQHHQEVGGGGGPYNMPLHYDHPGSEYQGSSQSMGLDDAKVFNFEEQSATNEFTSFAKFMSEARGEASTHHINQHSHSHSANSTRAMMMGSCMPPDNIKCQSNHYLGVKDEVDDLALLSPSLNASGSSNNPHQHDMKPKNYMSIEDDLGFLAELPPIEPEPLASDPNGNKSAAKDPGGFLQSFLSFIEGSTEPSANPILEVPSSSRGRRGAVRGRRGRGARGRTSGRRRGLLGVTRHSLDQRPYDWGCQTNTNNETLLLQDPNYIDHSSLPPPISFRKSNMEMGFHPNIDYSMACGDMGEQTQKDSMVPNPEAPSFSSDDDEDNNSGGIADSVAFVIRRLSEDEPPGGNNQHAKNSDPIKSSKSGKVTNYNSLKKNHQSSPPPQAPTAPEKSLNGHDHTNHHSRHGHKHHHHEKLHKNADGLSMSTYRKRSRKSKPTLMIQCSDSDILKAKICLNKLKPNEYDTPQDSQADSYEFVPEEEGMTSPRRTNSMRRCKVETMKKMEEKLKKRTKSTEEKTNNATPSSSTQPENNTSGEELDGPEESDSDPAWTPGSKPTDTASKASLSHNKSDSSNKRKNHHRRLNSFSLPQKLSLRFSAPKPINGDNNGIPNHNHGNNGPPGVIHLLKEGRVYTRVKETNNGHSDSNPKLVIEATINNHNDSNGLLVNNGDNGLPEENKFEQDNLDEDSGNSSDSSSGSSFKDETGSRTVNDLDDVLQGFFRTGDFVLSKNEVEICGAPLWQIEGKSLLQRFDTFEKDGRILYRNASTYSAWNPSLRNKYLGVTVRILYSSRAYTIVEYLGLSTTDIPEILTNRSDEPLDGSHPQREHFEVFLQTLISQVLDPNFITEIVKENDDYFLSHLKVIDEVTREKKVTLTDPSWDDQLKECAELYPCLNVMACGTELETQACKLCQKGSPVQHVVQFHGQLYDQITLNNQGAAALLSHNKTARRMSYALCEECLQALVSFHRLHHHKYNFFLKCHDKVCIVAQEREENAMKESHVILEHCLQDTLWVNELFSEMQEMWTTCEKPR